MALNPDGKTAKGEYGIPVTVCTSTRYPFEDEFSTKKEGDDITSSLRRTFRRYASARTSVGNGAAIAASVGAFPFFSSTLVTMESDGGRSGGQYLERRRVGPPSSCPVCRLVHEG